MTSSTSSSKGISRLLGRIALLAIIVLTINQLILAALPFAWGDDHFNPRFNYYRANRETYDTLFIGSSRVFRHMDPAAYDQEMAPFAPAASYNLGAPANLFPQTTRTFHEILASKPQALQTIIFELTELPLRPPPENWHTLRQIYWYDAGTTLDLLRLLWTTDIEPAEKRLYTAVHLGFLLEKNLNFGLGLDLLIFLLTDEYRNNNYLGQARNGFYPTDEQLITGTMGTKQSLAVRREAFLSNPEELARRAESSRKIYHDPGRWTDLDPVYLARLQQMLALADDADVELIFVLPPRLGEYYTSLLPLYHALPPANRLDLADPDQYPEFYDPELSFDVGHFNQAGAEQFSRKLARELIALRQLD